MDQPNSGNDSVSEQELGISVNSGGNVMGPSLTQENSEMGSNLWANSFSNEALLTQKRLNLMEAVRSVPVFTGDDPAVPFTLFCDKFKQFANYFQWSREDQFFAIQQRLAGSAQLIFLNFKNEVKSADDVFKLLRERFGQVKHPADILAEFWAFTQPASMRVADYMAQARQKVRAVTVAQEIPVDLREDIEQKWLLSMLLKNLNKNFRRGVIARNPTTLTEFEQIAISEEKAWISTRETQSTLNLQATEFIAAVNSTRSKSNDEEISKLKDLVEEMSVKLDTIAGTVNGLVQNQGNSRDNYANREDRSNNFPAIVCHYCNRPGHTKRFCRKLQQDNANFSAQRGGFRNNNNYRGNNRNANRGRGNFNNSRGATNSGRGGNNSAATIRTNETRNVNNASQQVSNQTSPPEVNNGNNLN